MQTEYLEKVFFIIDKNDNNFVESCLKKNERTSFEWCERFKVLISPNRHLAGDSQTCQLTSFQ